MPSRRWGIPRANLPISSGPAHALPRSSVGKRALTVEMIHKISTAWHIPPAVLVRPYETDNAV